MLRRILCSIRVPDSCLRAWRFFLPQAISRGLRRRRIASPRSFRCHRTSLVGWRCAAQVREKCGGRSVHVRARQGAGDRVLIPVCRLRPQNRSHTLSIGGLLIVRRTHRLITPVSSWTPTRCPLVVERDIILVEGIHFVCFLRHCLQHLFATGEDKGCLLSRLANHGDRSRGARRGTKPATDAPIPGDDCMVIIDLDSIYRASIHAGTAGGTGLLVGGGIIVWLYYGSRILVLGDTC